MARRKINWEEVPFNKESNARLAAILQCSRWTVGAWRRKLGRGAFRSPNEAKKNLGIPWSKFESVLGRLPDAEIARSLVVNDTLVRAARERRGIPAYRASAPSVRAEAEQLLRLLIEEFTDPEGQHPPGDGSLIREELKRRIERGAEEQEKRQLRQRLRGSK